MCLYSSNLSSQYKHFFCCVCTEISNIKELFSKHISKTLFKSSFMVQYRCIDLVVDSSWCVREPSSYNRCDSPDVHPYRRLFVALQRLFRYLRPVSHDKLTRPVCSLLWTQYWTYSLCVKNSSSNRRGWIVNFTYKVVCRSRLGVLIYRYDYKVYMFQLQMWTETILSSQARRNILSWLSSSISVL